MHGFILWCGFAGAWLLVAGPVYQALLELEGEEIENERIAAAADDVEKPETSPWWWLLPPVAWWIRRSRRARFQQAVLERLSDEDYEALQRFVNKAMGWALVAIGALLIATKETYEVVEYQEWHLAVFWVLVVVMAALCLGHAAARSAHDGRTAEIRSAQRSSQRSAERSQRSDQAIG